MLSRQEQGDLLRSLNLSDLSSLFPVYPLPPWPPPGVHAINTTARPFLLDDLTIQQVESHFTRKIGDYSAYDSFMDFTLVLYTPDLDTFMRKFDDAGETYLPLEWTGESGDTYYSIIKQVPGSQIVLELVSSGAGTVVWSRDVVTRLPDATFSDNNVTSAEPGMLTPLAVSLGSSNITAVADFYHRILQATTSLSSTSTDGEITLRTFKVPATGMHLRVVQRPPEATAGHFKIADLEAAKLRAHTAFSAGSICGFSKWYDNHWCWDQAQISLNTLLEAWQSTGLPFHIWGDGPGSTPNVYGVGPTGDAIQLDGVWTSCTGDCAQAEGNALTSSCMMGNCEASVTSGVCVGHVRDLCPSVNASTCIDCVLFHWDTITSQGCTIADAAFHCTGY